MLKLITALTAMSLLLLSCGPHGYWTREDFTDRQWAADSYGCQYNAELVCYANAPINRPRWQTDICVNRHFSMCIRSKGYFWVENK